MLTAGIKALLYPYVFYVENLCTVFVMIGGGIIEVEQVKSITVCDVSVLLSVYWKG